MKFILKCTTFLIISISIFGCSKDDILNPDPPTVDFTFTGANQPAPTIVNFTSNTTKALNYNWDFGDGTFSTLSNPSHTYATGGNYNVKLTASGTGGTNSTTKTVTIGNAISKVKITKIEVIAIPLTNGILNWDTSTDKPDLYIKLFDETGASGPVSTTLWNFIPSLTNTFSVTFTSPITMTNLNNSILKVQVWDNDTDNTFDLNGDDKIGEVPFTFRNYTSGTNKYPAFVLESSNGTMVIIYTTWE